MKISDYICRYLENYGVKFIYGFTGGVITQFIDSIYKSTKIKFVHINHEQAAAFAASALAKYTNRLQVATATSGPGATNLITGIADAFFDSAPVLFITGQVNTNDFKYNKKIRQQGFQETDIVNIVKPITKYSALVDNQNNIVYELKKACSIALSGRKGPVLLDIPFNIQRAEIEITPDDYLCSLNQNKNHISQQEFENITSIIEKSKKPVILSGGGCSMAMSKEILIDFTEKFRIPVVVSLMGKDSFPHDHELFGGFIGSYGNRYGNIILAKSDLLIVLGSRLDSRQTGNIIDPFKKKKIIWVDIDNNEIACSKLKAYKSFNCDVNFFLKEFIKYIKSRKINVNREKYNNILNTLKLEFSPLSEFKRDNKSDWHYQIMNLISDLFKDDDVICVDVGQIQMLAAQVIKINNNQRFINSGGMAPMGYALPAAIGISKHTGKRSIVIVGDGGMQINIQELNTVIKNKLPIIIIVFNNKSLGMIKQFQELYFEKRYCATDESSGYYSCDFKKIGESYGIKSFKVNKDTKNINNIFNNIFNILKGPVLLEIDINYNTYIFPKLSFDKPIDELNPLLNLDEQNKIDNLFKEL